MMFSRYVLLTINSLFFLIGLVALSIGLWSKYDKNFSTLWNQTFLSKLIYGNRLNNASVLMIVSGSLTLIVSFIGCLGAYRKNRVFLSIYSFILFVLIALQIATLVFTLSYQQEFRVGLLKALNQTVSDVNDGDTTARASMDSIQTVFKCCGCTSPLDYTTLTPMSSCETPESTPAKRIYWSIGCYDSILNYLNIYKRIIVLVSVSTIVFELFCLMISCRTLSLIKDERFENLMST